MNNKDNSVKSQAISTNLVNSNEITAQSIQNLIISLPNRPPAMLAKDLAEVYETTTSAINQAVDRNKERFPEDFYFQSTDEETIILKSQSVMSKKAQTANPYLFTREGANMLSAVLHTDIAIQRSIQIMRAFSAIEAAKESDNKPIDLKNITRLDMAKMLLRAEEDREAAERQVKLLETEKRFNQPKVEAWNSFLESDGYYTLTGAFKMLQLPPKISIRKLREDKVLYKLQKANTPYEQYIQKGYFVVKVNRNEQLERDFPQTYVTPAGLEWLRAKFFINNHKMLEAA